MFLFLQVSMETKKPTLKQFRKQYPREYAVLSERMGYKNEALRCYAHSQNAEEVIHAAEIAIQLTRYNFARRLLKKAVELSGNSLGLSRSCAYSSPGSMGAGIGLCNAEDADKKIRNRVSELEAELNRK